MTLDETVIIGNGLYNIPLYCLPRGQIFRRGGFFFISRFL
jgi:hypothetical protein